MDQFTYMACKAELQNCKSVAKAELLVRKSQQKLLKTKLYNSYNTITELSESAILLYKLYTLALNTHANLSKAILPDFLHTAKHNAHRCLLLNLLTKLTTDYNQFIDIFEFDSVLDLPVLSNAVEKLDAVIADNPVHFTVIWNNRLTTFDTYSTKLEQSAQTYAYALRYKQVNYPNEPRTIWDEFLAQSTVTVLDTTPVQDSIIKLQQQITALKTIKDLT